MKRTSMLLGFGAIMVATLGAFNTVKNHELVPRKYWSGGAPGEGECKPFNLLEDCVTSQNPDCIVNTGTDGPQQMYTTNCIHPLERE